MTERIHVEGCNFCGELHETSSCPLLKTAQKVTDIQVPSRAHLTLPHNLELQELQDGSLTVFSKAKIPAGTQFGPLDAPRVVALASQSDFPLKIFSKDGPSFYLDTSCENHCNWMCLVSVVNNKSDQNLIAYQLHNDIYFSAQKDIKQGEELKVWYSFPYEKKLRRTVENEKSENRETNENQEILNAKRHLLSSDLNNRNSDVQDIPVKRRRGRPPKVQSVESDVLQRNASLSSVNNEDIAILPNAEELGVMEEQQEWQCSQCSALYDNCIDFAKHLQEHYRPPNFRKRSRGSGMCQKDTDWIYNRAIRQSFKGNQRDRARRIKKCKFPIRKLKNCERKITGKYRNKLRTKSTKFVNHGELVEELKDFNIHKEKEDTPAKLDEKYNNYIKAQLNCNTTSHRSKEPLYGSKEQDNCNSIEKKMCETKTTKRPTVISLHEGEQEMLKNGKESLDPTEKVNTNYGSDLEIVECQSPTIINISEDLSVTKGLVNSENALVSVENEETSSASEWSETTKINLVDDQWKGKNLHVAILNFECKNQPKKYRCDLCSKSFNKTYYLYRHIKKHTGEFTCSVCHKVFARKENMLKHMCIKSTKNKDGKEFDHECSYCKKKFSTDRLLLRHMAKHTGEFTCNECGKPYSTKDTLLNHVCSVNPTSESYSCPVCSKIFSKHIYLIKHLPVHTGQHSCSICGKWLRSADSLTNHLRMCNQVQEIEEKGKTTCASCHKEFTDVAEFRQHQYQHTHIHSCDSCGAKFRNLVSLRLHMCHGASIICDICNKVFTSISSMRQHRVSHGEQLKCSDCGKYFNNKIILRKHSCDKITIKANQKAKEILHPFICEVCGSKFSSSSSLNVHKNLHGEKKYVCKVCGKRFHRKDLLLEHYAVHGDPTFPCSTCNKLFKTKKSLDVHMMIHEGVKRFQCSTCGKEFYQKGNLQKHEETHNKERKYSCSVCQKSFSTKEYLKVHIAEHTWGRIYMCGICKKSFVRPHQLKSHHKMFHGNQAYSCKYCNLTLKLRHSLKRHLKKKHMSMEKEWNDPEIIKSMLMTVSSPVEKEQLQSQTTELQLQMSELTSTQGAEVLLAVAGIDGQILHEALASGQAQIKKGTVPNTIEISVPVNLGNSNSSNVDSINVDSVNQSSIVNVPSHNSITTPVPKLNDVNDAESKMTDAAVTKHCLELNNEQIVVLNQELDSENQMEVESVSQNCEKVEQNLTEHQVNNVNAGEKYAENIVQEAQLAQLDEGQHIVITEGDLPEGTHHIFVDTSQLKTIASSGESLPEGAIVVESGTVLQPEGGTNVTDFLLYVLTTENQ